MTGGISLYNSSSSNEGLSQVPSLSSCASCTRAETEIRALLNDISANFLKNPSHFLGFIGLPSTSSVAAAEVFDNSQLFNRWAEKFDLDCDPKSPPLCPDLKRRIKDHVSKLLNGSSMASLVALAAGSNKRKCAENSQLLDSLMSLKAVAACPYDDQTREEQEWTLRVLNARKALFLKTADVSNMEEFPYLKKQRTNKFPHSMCTGTANLSSEKYQNELSAGVGSYDIQNQPIRRSRRTLLNLGESEIHRKRIPIGHSFQADVPVRTGPLNYEGSNGNTELNDSRWLGTQIWPIEDDSALNNKGTIGEGRSDMCACTSPGSVDCIRSHVRAARLHLRSELGPAFSSLGFNDMGEEVSSLWTHEEQLMFDDLVRFNPSSEGESFWETAVKCFTSKSRQDIVSFYFNVFVLRWMSIRTRLASSDRVDIDDDANLG